MSASKVTYEFKRDSVTQIDDRRNSFSAAAERLGDLRTGFAGEDEDELQSPACDQNGEIRRRSR